MKLALKTHLKRWTTLCWRTALVLGAVGLILLLEVPGQAQEEPVVVEGEPVDPIDEFGQSDPLGDMGAGQPPADAAGQPGQPGLQSPAELQQDIDPGSVPPFDAGYLDTLIQQGQWDEVERLVRVYHHAPTALRVAWNYYDMGEYLLAEQWFNQALTWLDQFPGPEQNAEEVYPNALYGKGLALFQSERYDAAEEFARQYREDSEQLSELLADTLLIKAGAAMKQGRYREAIEMIDEAKPLRPAGFTADELLLEGWANYNLGWENLQQFRSAGEPFYRDVANEYFDRAAQIFLNTFPLIAEISNEDEREETRNTAIEGLARTEYARGNYQEAYRLVNSPNYTADDADDIRREIRSGVLAAIYDDLTPQQKVQYLEALRQRNPLTLEQKLDHAMQYLQLRQFETAGAIFGHILEQNPPPEIAAQAYMGLAFSANEMGQSQIARAAAARALDLRYNLEGETTLALEEMMVSLDASMAVEAYSAGDYPLALQLLNRVRQVRPLTLGERAIEAWSHLHLDMPRQSFPEFVSLYNDTRNIRAQMVETNPLLPDYLRTSRRRPQTQYQSPAQYQQSYQPPQDNALPPYLYERTPAEPPAYDAPLPESFYPSPSSPNYGTPPAAPRTGFPFQSSQNLHQPQREPDHPLMRNLFDLPEGATPAPSLFDVPEDDPPAYAQAPSRQTSYAAFLPNESELFAQGDGDDTVVPPGFAQQVMQQELGVDMRNPAANRGQLPQAFPGQAGQYQQQQLQEQRRRQQYQNYQQQQFQQESGPYWQNSAPAAQGAPYNQVPVQYQTPQQQFAPQTQAPPQTYAPNPPAAVPPAYTTPQVTPQTPQSGAGLPGGGITDAELQQLLTELTGQPQQYQPTQPIAGQYYGGQQPMPSTDKAGNPIYPGQQQFQQPQQQAPQQFQQQQFPQQRAYGMTPPVAPGAMVPAQTEAEQEQPDYYRGQYVPKLEDLAKGVFLSGVRSGQIEEVKRLARQWGGPLAEETADRLRKRKLYMQVLELRPDVEPNLINYDSSRLNVSSFLRSKSGNSGQGQLDIFHFPVVTYEQKSFFGDESDRVAAQAALISVDSGSLEDNAAFGRFPRDPTRASRSNPESSYDNLLELKMKWWEEDWTSRYVQLGTTPINGPISATMTGRIGVIQQIDRGFWSAEIFRESRKESVLSYVGTKDPYANDYWGQVVENGISVETLFGLADDQPNPRENLFDENDISLFAKGTIGFLTGDGVADNTHFGATLALQRLFKSEMFDYLLGGVAFSAEHYSRNLSFFTRGHGGYFSPEYLLQTSLFVQFLTQEGYEHLIAGSASVGFQTNSQEAAPFFPLNPDGRDFDSTRESTPIAQANVEGAFLINSDWKLGLTLSAAATADYDEFYAGISLTYFFEPRRGLYSTDLSLPFNSP